MNEYVQSQLLSSGKSSPTKGTQGEKGNSVGLLIIKEYLEMNDGKLSFTSHEGMGSTFTICIPNYKQNNI